MATARKETISAILLFTLVLLGNAVIFAIVPHLTQPERGHGFHAFQIMLCYCAIATVCMLPWALRQGRKGLATKQWKLYGARAVLEYGAFTLSFYSLGYLGDYFTLPMHTALNFITPLLATIAAIFILKERGYPHTWLALGIGFAGVLIITQPGMIPLSPGVLYVLGAAVGFSLCGIVIKLLTRTESANHVAFYMLALTAILAAPAGIAHWKAPSAEGWFWLVVIGVIAFAQQVLVAKAIAKVPYMVLIPLNFVQLVFATALGFAVYGQTLGTWTLIGSLVILGGTLYNASRSRHVAEKQAIEASVV